MLERAVGVEPRQITGSVQARRSVCQELVSGELVVVQVTVRQTGALDAQLALVTGLDRALMLIEYVQRRRGSGRPDREDLSAGRQVVGEHEPRDQACGLRLTEDVDERDAPADKRAPTFDQGSRQRLADRNDEAQCVVQ